jgi:endogenous inhibitor of DNA gyrase (YacG/DUF329 family)
MYCGGNVSIIGDMKCRCPVCRKLIDRAIQRQSREGKFYPFCSQRCKLVDLGRWLDSKYRIATPLRTEEAEQVSEEPANGQEIDGPENAGQRERRGR